MVGVARSGREPGACAGARQRDTRGGGRGTGTCLQPGPLSPGGAFKLLRRIKPSEGCWQVFKSNAHYKTPQLIVAKLSDF